MIIALVILFSIYAGYIWLKYGQLSSISASSYLVPQWLFTLWLTLMGFGSYWIDPSFWTAYMGMGFIIAGNTPNHKKNPNNGEDEFHFWGTLVAILAGFGGLWFMHGQWIPHVVMIAGSLVLWLYAKNKIWWIELLAMATIATGYYIAVN